MAGQGTVALEMLQQLSDLEVILVPVGGGGLLAGMASAVKAFHPKVRIIGVQALGAAVLPGDGIGPEVMDGALKVLKAVGDWFNHEFEVEKGYRSGIAD